MAATKGLDPNYTSCLEEREVGSFTKLDLIVHTIHVWLTGHGICQARIPTFPSPSERCISVHGQHFSRFSSKQDNRTP